MVLTPPTGAAAEQATAAPAMESPADDARAHFVKCAGVRLEGEGRPLLLINGLLHGRELWDPMVRHLVAGRRTVRFDFPHQNGSVLADDYANFERYCDFVQDLLDTLGIRCAETDAFGFSIGGDVLRTLVVERHLRFRRIIMAASAPPGVERFWKEFFTSAIECLRRGHLDTFVRLIAFQFHSPVYIERYPKLLHVMHLKYLQRFADLKRLETLLTMPLQRRRPDPVCDVALRGTATLVHCLYDQLVPIGPARAYARYIGLPVHEIESGHSLLAEAPHEVASIATKILNAED